MEKIIHLAGGGTEHDQVNVFAIEKNFYNDIKSGKYYVEPIGGEIWFDYFQDDICDSLDKDIANSIIDFIKNFENNIRDEDGCINAIPIEIIDIISEKFDVDRETIEEIFNETMSKKYNDAFGESLISELEIKYKGESNIYSIVNVTTLW